MKQVPIDKTNLNVSRLSFGTASIHHIFNQKERQNLLKNAIDLGFTHFDTSPYYGFGLAEIELGKILKPKYKKISIATKVGIYPPYISNNILNTLTIKCIGKVFPSLSKADVDWSIKRAAKSIDLSLKRLNTNFIDIVYLHEPISFLINFEELTLWKEDLIRNGIVGYFGIAGPIENYLDSFNSFSSFSDILQVKDNFDSDGIEALNKINRIPQFSYGSYNIKINPEFDYYQSLIRSLNRNESGSVIISTRKLANLKNTLKYLEIYL